MRYLVKILTKNNNILCKNILLNIRTSNLLLVLSNLLPEICIFMPKITIKIKFLPRLLTISKTLYLVRILTKRSTLCKNIYLLFRQVT